MIERDDLAQHPRCQHRIGERGRGAVTGKDPVAGLTVQLRAIVVVDEKGTVTYTQLVPEIKEEPNYDAALAAVK